MLRAHSDLILATLMIEERGTELAQSAVATAGPLSTASNRILAPIPVENE